MLAVTLNLKEKSVVVVGGGKIAARKIQSLLTESARVKVISPEISGEIENLVLKDQVEWIQRDFKASDVHQAFLIIAATNNHQVNAFVAKSCTENQLINIVDDPTNSSFHFNAIVKRGLLTIAVSTGGASPIVAKQIRDDIAQIYDEQYEQYMQFLLKARATILQADMSMEESNLLLRKLAEPQLRESVKLQQQFLENITR